MSKVKHINVGLEYVPRDIFVPFHRRKQRWACLICHRRAGKTVASIMDLIDHAWHVKHGRYAYIAPLRNQAKTVAWDYLKHYARPLFAKPPNEAELRVDLVGGSRITLFGADNPDALRGPFFDGVAIDEYADIPPSLLGQIIRPALADRKGFAIIMGTIKGYNQLWELFSEAANDESWFTALLKASETGVLGDDELADARRLMTAEAYAAEFECDPSAAIMGAFFGRELAAAAADGRLPDTLPLLRGPVHTAWDLGQGANMAVWAFQEGERGPLVRDFIQLPNFYLEDYLREVNRRGYDGYDYVPSDAKVPSFETGRTRIETMLAAGRKPRIVPPHGVEDGINAAKITLQTAKFAGLACERGIEALRQYRQEWDEKAKVFKKAPRHDHNSHAADGFRYLAMAWKTYVVPTVIPLKPDFKPTSELSIDEYVSIGGEGSGKDRRI